MTHVAEGVAAVLISAINYNTVSVKVLIHWSALGISSCQAHLLLLKARSPTLRGNNAIKIKTRVPKNGNKTSIANIDIIPFTNLNTYPPSGTNILTNMSAAPKTKPKQKSVILSIII